MDVKEQLNAQTTIYSFYTIHIRFDLQRPIGAYGEFSPGLMCVRRGPINVELRIGRRGYVPGECVAFYVEIENESRWKIYGAKVAVVQVRRVTVT